MSYSERTQVLLTPEQRTRLERIAEREGTSLGAVIREAVEQYTVPRTRPRVEALEELFDVQAQVDDWDVMKDEIAGGALE